MAIVVPLSLSALALLMPAAPVQRQQPPGAHLSRRSAILTFSSPLVPLLLPLPAANAISATTMAGKSKAELGIILADEAKQSGASVSADLPTGAVRTVRTHVMWCGSGAAPSTARCRIALRERLSH